MEGVKLDKWGYPVRTSSDSCISAINAFYHQVLSYGRERYVILEAPAHDKDCVLANILAAHFLNSSDPSRAPSHVHAAKSRLEQATPFEKAVFEAVSYLISEDRDDDVVVQLHSELLKEFPRDLVSLKRAQVFCFYMGRPDLSLNLVQQVEHENEGANYFYGMLAFALLELGCTEDAEEAAKKGFEINKDDTWAQHALCHVLQYQCRFKEAVEFMEACSSSWSSLSSFMLTHNWWHVALCYLEAQGPIQRIREIYDHDIWKELQKSDTASAEVYLNAAGLLLRIYIRGEIDFFEDQMKLLAECLMDPANWHLEWHLDLLIIWTLAKSGEFSKAEDIILGLKSRVSRMEKKKQQKMRRGMQLAEAIYEYGRGNDKLAVELLGADFDAFDCKMIGASDEQLDVFNELWYSMLLSTGQATKAIELIEKRIKKREGVPFLWRLLERGYNLENKQEARNAREKAMALETAYFN